MAVIDLTGFCSSKSKAGAEGGERKSSMESNRSRRRRLNGDSNGNFRDETRKIGDGVKSADAASDKDNSFEKSSGNDAEESRRKDIDEASHRVGAAKSQRSENDHTTVLPGKSQYSQISKKSTAAAKTKTNNIQKSKTATGQEVLEILSDDDEIEEPVSKTVPLNYRKQSQNHEQNSLTDNSERNRKRPCRSADEGQSDQLSKRSTLESSQYASMKHPEISTDTSNRKDPTTTSTANNTKINPKSLTDYYKPSPISIEALMQQATTVLKRQFGHSSLRDLQKTAVQRALQQTSQIIIMATGGGKSICYQLPALVGYGTSTRGAADSFVTIVVCPLIALMADQVKNLHRKGILTAACLSSSQSAKENADVYERLMVRGSKKEKGKGAKEKKLEVTPIQLLYVTPELIKTDKFRGVLNKLYESRRLFQIAIDEAHCVSTWGHDFRTAYKELSWLREAFPDAPIMACESMKQKKKLTYCGEDFYLTCIFHSRYWNSYIQSYSRH